MLEEINWNEISSKPGLSEEFIRENSDKVNWCIISEYQRLSEDFIREFSDKVHWGWISSFQKLSECFIRENSDKVYWHSISCYQKLSEKFIKEFSDKVHWNLIFCYQKLSEKFISKNYSKAKFECIEIYQKLSNKFIKRHNLEIPETCWLYKDKEYKREYIQKHTEYEIIGDKIIAYKTCREDGYSCYNFQYLYEVGKEYEAHADYNIDHDNSFGLSAWTKERALGHHPNGKLFKVEIDLEDIAAIIHNKIRARKIKILEDIII
jgi:hypothetical protein